MKIKKMAAWTGAAVLATGAAAMGAPMASAAVDVVAQADAATSEAPAPTETTAPSETTAPTETSKPTETSEPSETSKPTETSKPSESTKPTKTSEKTPASKARPVEPKEKPKKGDRGVPARTGDNDAAWAAAGGVVLISVAGGVYALRRRASQ